MMRLLVAIGQSFMWLGRIKDPVDVIQKVVVGLIAGLISVYISTISVRLNDATLALTTARDNYEKEKFCFNVQSAVLSAFADKPAPTKSVTQEQVAARVKLAESVCVIDARKLHGIIVEVTGASRNQCDGLACNEVPVATRPAGVTSDASKSGVGAADPGGSAPTGLGWVAVGFLGSAVFSEINFDMVNLQQSRTTLIASKISVDDVLFARWQVNIRRAAADWRNDPIGLVDTGQCVRVLSVQSLPAGARQQTWAEVARAKCPPGIGSGGGNGGGH